VSGNATLTSSEQLKAPYPQAYVLLLSEDTEVTSSLDIQQHSQLEQSEQLSNQTEQSSAPEIEQSNITETESSLTNTRKNAPDEFILQ